MKWLKRVGTGLLVLLVAAAIALAVPARKVGTTDMEPSVFPGDWVWVLPDEPTPGDLVVMADPLDPSRTVLRRIVAGGEQRVSWDDGGFRVNGKRVRQQEKEPEGSILVAKETIWSLPPAKAKAWVIRRSDTDRTWASEPYDIPEGHWYVLADDRDWAMDSRWWGAVPDEAIEGVVRARWGQATDRVEAFELLKGVGPWNPAPPRRKR